MKRKTLSKLKNEINKIFNYEYDLSKINYINNKTKIEIICSEHGSFFKRPDHLLNGSGCPECAKNKRKWTTEMFIEKSKKIHDNKYDYSLVEYINSKTKIKIICLDHGIFEQTPNIHLSDSGCFKCALIHDKNILKYKFIEKANKVHNNKYDYSLIEYKNNKIKEKIICPIHGQFEQRPDSHLNGNGCSKCAILSLQKKLRLDKDLIIEKANKIHQNKYNYSKINYKNLIDLVSIICPIHGEFKQTLKNHLNGHGCPICKNSKGELEIRKILIEKNISFKQQYKFKDCKDKLVLPFDFYLLDYNLCIEYDGRQHFEAVDYFGGEKNLKIQQKHDQIKNIYCNENNINLLRIKYNENIKNELTTFFEKYL